MKIKFSYQPGEEKRAYLVCNLVVASLRKLDGKNPRVKERQEHPPIKHIYITSKPPVPDDGDGASISKRRGSGENARPR